MKTLVLITMLATSLPAVADQLVRGHVKSDGTYVAPYIRTSPNNVQFDNYSTEGNTNPYTGQRGSQRDSTYDVKPVRNPYGR